MRIVVKSEDKTIRLTVPTALIFNSFVAWVAGFALRYADESVPGISPKSIDALFAEFRRIKKKHGSWDLVDIERADGSEVVKICL